uniref:Ig-like domain-containing protein n=1 Tax=Timema poppense TaxID=170557 RepID=A0A7R9GWF4_TIMPO|nr:unnamed protein product [Timema poppensis]
MGAYLCIASNGVPPTVSKRIKVSVDFPPMLWIPHQLVGAPLGYGVTLECFTEAHPTSLNYWTREDGHMIHDTRKYTPENTVGVPPYKTHMRLTIVNIQEKDYGTYKCVAKNPRGETDGTIRLYNNNDTFLIHTSVLASAPMPLVQRVDRENSIDPNVGASVGSWPARVGFIKGICANIHASRPHVGALLSLVSTRIECAMMFPDEDRIQENSNFKLLLLHQLLQRPRNGDIQISRKYEHK